MKSTTVTNVNGFTAVTTQVHTPQEIRANNLAAWWRGLVNQDKLKRLILSDKEGSAGVSHDARAGFGRLK